jgi:hypothetical protein
MRGEIARFIEAAWVHVPSRTQRSGGLFASADASGIFSFFQVSKEILEALGKSTAEGRDARSALSDFSSFGLPRTKLAEPMPICISLPVLEALPSSL